MNLRDCIYGFNETHSEKKSDMIELLGKPNIEVDDIAIDSKTVSPGTLFVALKGHTQDGHDYIDDAIARGASAVLSQEPISKKYKQATKTTFIQVTDTKEALRHLAPYFFNYPATKLNLIGITGTNGKTTTAYLVEALLNHAGKKTGLISTITTRYGHHEKKEKNTTPGLLDLQKIFSEMQKTSVTDVVMEVSSHALDQERVAGCIFETAVFTNLTQDHLDYHHTMENYFAAKKTLFEQTKGQWIVNLDDNWGKKLQETAPDRVWAYGIDHHDSLYPLCFKSTLAGLSMCVQSPIGEIEIEAHLSGRHNVYNILAAIGVGIASGLSKMQITEGIAALKQIPGRFEKIDLGQNFTVIVDYAHTPDALERLLSAVKTLGQKKIITCFGCGGDRDRDKRPLMGVAAMQSDFVILSSDNPRSEDPDQIISEIASGISAHSQKTGQTCHYDIISDRREAISHAIALAKPGDVVIIAGKGHETDQQIGTQIIAFDDRACAREALIAQNKTDHGER